MSPYLKFDGLKVVNTPFGWSVAGPLLGHAPTPTLTTTVTPDKLDQDLARLWELDQVPDSPAAMDDDQVIADFQSSYTRHNGRFMVKLPRRCSPAKLGKSRPQAVRRLLANEKTLRRKDKLHTFNDALREYISLDHAEIIPRHEIDVTPHYYLPVHGVFKDSSTTAKLLPIFDASAKTTSGVSLNDILLPGPCQYPPLSDVLIRFRKHCVGVSADISKMFREVLLHPEDRDLHWFILRDEAGALIDCRMKRVTFGITSLATQVVRTLANIVSVSYSLTAQRMQRDFYVDDLLFGADTVQEADQLRRETCDILESAGMTLRKWRTNSAEF